MGNKKLFASFVGINAYPSNPLDGCIKDVLSFDSLLRDQCAQQNDTPIEYKPIYFLAPNKADEAQIDDYCREKELKILFDTPDFSNITGKAFQHFCDADDGDICVFYYSGHGSYTDAPEVFWHSKPDRQNETIVCVDSRDPAKPGARDLIDKEIAFLLWKNLPAKAIHCLVVMDCCHSGNNTREMRESKIKYRHEASANKQVPLESYIGYNDVGNFYKVKNGKATIEIARYVHFAAALDDEKAQESMNGGLFTSKLVEMLRTGGTAKSYRELVKGLSISVHNKSEHQNPVAYARDERDLDEKFLGQGIVPFQPYYGVYFDFGADEWLLSAGAMQGLLPSHHNTKTTIRVAGIVSNIEVIEVRSTTSVLQPEALEPLDPKKVHMAVLGTMATPILKIGLSAPLKKDGRALDNIKATYASQPHLYFEIDFVANEAADYLVQLTKEGDYVLTGNSSSVPIFKREKNATDLLKNIDVVGKWLKTTGLKNKNSNYGPSDFIFTWEKIEGTKFNEKTWDDVLSQSFTAQPDEEIQFSYRDGIQPAFRLSIQINPASALQRCYIGALYLDSKFGINPVFIQADQGKLEKGKSAIELKTILKNREYRTIPLKFDRLYQQYAISEITDLVKIFVANEPIDLSNYMQESLTLENLPLQFRDEEEKFKSAELDEDDDNQKEEHDWNVFDFKIRIAGPAKEKLLTAREAAQFPAFTISAPEGFSARVFTATGDDQKGKSRSFRINDGSNEDEQVASLFPSEKIWGEALIHEIPFASGMSTGANNGVQVIELMPVDEKGPALQLPEGKSIVITPNQRQSLRSIDDVDETIIPFGYDQAAQMYIPLGFTDEKGNIHIVKLPPPSARQLSIDNPKERSIGSSVKLFFKKILRKKQINTLALYEYEKGDWQKRTDVPEEMQTLLSKKPKGLAMLVIHGITGDTRSITGELKEIKQLPGVVQFMLTYDYENLATSIAKNADYLLAQLKSAGFDKPGMPSLVVVAHSMGGLVARCMVEKEGSVKIKDMVLAGTPSAGSEMAMMGTSLLNLLSHAMNVTGPIKYAITGLSFLLKKLELDPTRTLHELKTGSAFLGELKVLNKSKDVNYHLIGGDTSLLASKYNGDDFFLKKIGAALANNLVYPGLTHSMFGNKANDMAVTLESMKAINGIDPAQFSTLATNHLGYFRDKECREKIVSILKQHQK